MRKLYLVILIATIMIAASAGVYILIFQEEESPSRLDNPHFTVGTITYQPAFAGENVIARALVVNDEPAEEIAVPTTTEILITPAPDDEKGLVEVTVAPTIIVQKVPAAGSHLVTARLSGSDGIDVVRKEYVSLASDESKTASFDFGPVPAGSYVVTVTAPSYNNSSASRTITVYPQPLLGEWVELGGVAFQFVNLRHNGVDLIIRNSGEHTVTFSESQYTVYVNCSKGYNTTLQVPGQTMITPGQTASVHGNITIARSYYLEYFAIRSPDRTTLVKVPVDAQMSPAS